MSWWRRRDNRSTYDRWLAGRLLDDALCVFGALQAAASAHDPRLTGELRERLRATSLDVLDDVACLAELAGSAALSAPGPGDPSPGPEPASSGRGDEQPALRAVQALGDYSERLVAVALVFASRDDETSTAFVELAAVAEARIEILAA
jgi:hypothetical protein